MTIMNAFSTMGGTASTIKTPLEATHTLDDLDEVDNAFAIASEALDAAERLEEAAFNYKGMSKTTAKLLNVAVENYLDKFKLPKIALESSDLIPYDSNSSSIDEDEEENRVHASRLKKVAKQLYAFVERIFKAIFDYFTTQKTLARRLIPLTKKYIGESDPLSEGMAIQLRVRDRGVMLALHIDGNAPKNPVDLFTELSTTLEKQHSYTAVSEVIHFITAVKEKNKERIAKEAKVLRDKLEEGLKASLSPVNPSSIAVFTEKKSDRVNYYATKPMFGQRYIVGLVGKEVSDSGMVRFTCAARQDMAVPLRAKVFPVLTPEQIRQICRLALKVCENVIRFSRDEELMKKALREASYLTSKETDQAAVAALRNIAAVGQNSYIVHLRYVTRTTQSLLRWCAQSIARYEEVRRNG